MPNAFTEIPAPRVDFIDPRTGKIAREWYLFLLNLYVLAGGGSNSNSLTDLQKAPVDASAARLDVLATEIDSARLASDVAELRALVAELSQTDIEGQLAQLREQVAYGMAGLKRKRVIAGSITINSPSTSGTFTISPALGSLDMCDLRFLGFTHSSDVNGSSAHTAVELTNTTTVTARRVTSGNTSVAYFQITEYEQ